VLECIRFDFICYRPMKIHRRKHIGSDVILNDYVFFPKLHNTRLTNPD